MAQDHGTPEYEVEIEFDDAATPVQLPGQDDDQTQDPEPRDKKDAEGDGEGDDSRPKTKKQKAQERISELTRKYRDEERRRIEREQQLESYKQRETQFQQSYQQERQQNLALIYEQTKENKDLLTQQLEQARRVGDFKMETSLQDKLGRVRDRVIQLENMGAHRAQPAPAANQQGYQQSQTPQQASQQAQGQQQQPQSQPTMPTAAVQWIEANKFLKDRPDLHNQINHMNEFLKAKGMDPSSPDFYREINKRLKTELTDETARKNLKDPWAEDTTDDDVDYGDDDSGDDDAGEQEPSRQQQSQPRRQSPTAGGERGTSRPSQPGKRKVKLTRDQVAMANNLNLTPQQYAAQLARQEQNTNANGYTVIGDN